MLLIDKKGARVRAICRECRKVHAAKDCPKRRARRLAQKRADEVFAWVMAYRERLRA